MYVDEKDPPALSASITVWVVEDHESYRDTIKLLLDNEQDIYCSALFGDCESMLKALTPKAAPNVVLMDIGLPGMDGVRGVFEIKNLAPAVSVVMLTVHDDNDKIFDAICAGATGYLLKTAPAHSIIRAIRETREGGSVISPKIARRMVDRFAQKHSSRVHGFGLTRREAEVLELCKTGKSKKEMADMLFVSVHTIDSHMRKIFEKLQVNSRPMLMHKLYDLDL